MAVLAVTLWPGTATAHVCGDRTYHVAPDTPAACSAGAAVSRPDCERAGGTWTPPESGSCGGVGTDGDLVADTLAQVTDDAIEWTPWLVPLYGAIATLSLALTILAVAIRRGLDHLIALVESA